MKEKELKKLISESVKETLKSKTISEGFEVSSNHLGADIDLEPKVEHAVMLAAHCAKVLAGVVKKEPESEGSTLEKCFNDIIGLFVDNQGEYSVPELDINQLKNEFNSQVHLQISDARNKIAKMTKAILDKVIDKLKVYSNVDTSLAQESREVPTDPSWFDTQSDTEMFSREPKTNSPEARKIIDAFKRKILVLKKTGQKFDNKALSRLVQDQPVDFDTAWELAHVAIEELRDEKLFESPPSGWHGTVAAMKQHGHTGSAPGKIDNPYALAHYMKNKGDEPHYKEQPSSKHGRARKKKGQ